MKKLFRSRTMRPWIKYGLPPASILVSVLVMQLLFRSWFVALSIMGILLLHELGHLIVLWLKRIPTRGPFFIPLLGAFVAIPPIRKAEDVALIALSGPFFGGLGAAFCYAMAMYASSQDCPTQFFFPSDPLDLHLCFLFGHARMWLVLSYVGFYLNLLNLLPLQPLDGGRVAPILWRWSFVLGLPLGLILLKDTFNLSSPLLIAFSLLTLLLLLISVTMTIVSFRKPQLPLDPISVKQRLLIACIYLLLAVALGYGWWTTSSLLNYINQVLP
ncbi:hypothetical protein EI42_04143 [Thermosporothrix hazakensis]|jgi:Zn-dependent protease|uniref:Peptidase M50 domain-containing protein n=2 Tax=Thermosporothrix TaxID=768650 RepID=A0A326U3E7_THEHA|nr:site-2 protease family protein [Thermosporothrix hazakensis]PZW25650.1 hypothetical protein EI42_04143 [Thermosporothrix hazakensis]BBH89946.1 hypothetical protein KTC_46970 [Thermosporothrix sp. COM3]GCE48145.1 hypothetical protein KTH_30140 [Thermosporothrix hazakensis]